MSKFAHIRIIYILIIVTLCFVVRISVVSDRSISQDESTLTLFALGVLEKGYPFIRQKTGDFIISTYELVPFPIAASMLAFGKTEIAIRLPAMIFSCITAYLIFYMGERFHSRRAGLAAAIAFATLPWAIYWGTNGFYPSQLQCLTLITLIILNKILRTERPKAYLYYLIALAILMTYLSWEGSGFLLPVFFVTAMFITWRKWSWLKPIHAWCAATIIIGGVITQLAFRTVLRAPYTGQGTSRSDVSSLEPAFQAYSFDPSYYVNQLATSEHLFLFIFFVIGLFVLRKNWNAVYLYSIVLLALLFLTGFLGYYALRYVYFLLPAALVLSAMAAIEAFDRIAIKIGYSPGAKPVQAWLIFAAVIALNLLTSSPWGVQLSRLNHDSPIPLELNFNSKGFGFRSIAAALNRHLRQDDLIVVQAPFPFLLYTGETGDYFLQQGTATTVFYHPTGSPYYLDKWIQNPVLRNPVALQELLHTHARVWFVLVPSGASRTSIGDEMMAYLNDNTTVVEEVAGGQLLLWQNPYFSYGDK